MMISKNRTHCDRKEISLCRQKCLLEMHTGVFLGVFSQVLIRGDFLPLKSTPHPIFSTGKIYIL